MSILFLAFRAAGVLGIITSDLLMKSLTNTTSSIYGSILHLTSLDAPYAKDIVKYIKKIDLKFKLCVLDSFIKENENKINSNKESTKEVIEGVLEILNEIKAGLREVENAIQYHNTKYFANWRSFSCSYSLSKIKAHNNLLESRTKLLFKIID